MTTTTSTSTVTALGAGSGVDIAALAKSLVEAERAPAKAAIDKKVTAATNSVSGYAAIKYVLDNLKTAFADLKDQSDFTSLAPGISQPSALSVAAGATTASGSHTVTVTTLAAAQRNVSAGFAAATKINNGAAFNLTLTVGSGTAKTITVGEDTPAGIVAAINSANLGVTASLVKTDNASNASNPYKIMVTGTTGAGNSFTLASPVADLSFGNPLEPTACDGALIVDGVAITSSSNQVQGAIAGATLNLTGTTTIGTAATLNFTRDTASVKTKLQALVTAYNDANSMLGVVSDPKSTVDTFGATLVGNSIVSQVRNQMRNLVLPSVTASSGSSITSLRDLGVSVDKTGVLTLDANTLDSALSNKFDQAVTMLSANRENLSTYSALSGGVAGEAVKKLTTMLASTGSISAQSANATKKISDYNADLAKLETRMTDLLARYNKQFAVMDSIVGQTNSLRTNLTATFDGMMSMYTKN